MFLKLYLWNWTLYYIDYLDSSFPQCLIFANKHCCKLTMPSICAVCLNDCAQNSKRLALISWPSNFSFYCVMLMCETFVYIRLKLAFWSSRCPWSCIVTFHNAKPPRHDQTNIKIVKCCTKKAIFEPRRPVGCNHLLKYLLHSDLSTSVYTQPKMQVRIL